MLSTRARLARNLAGDRRAKALAIDGWTANPTLLNLSSEISFTIATGGGSTPSGGGTGGTAKTYGTGAATGGRGGQGGAATFLANGDESPSGCKIKAFTTVDVSVRYKFRDKTELIAGIANVFNKD